MPPRHPVWDLYDMLRTMKLNVKYYKEKQRRISKFNSTTELLLAILSSSAAAAWLNSNWGLVAWKILGSCATVLAVYRYVNKPSETIKKIENRITFYDTATSELEKLCREITTCGQYNDEIRLRFESLSDRIATFRVSYIDSDKDDELNEKCTEEVNREHPVNSFYIPGE